MIKEVIEYVQCYYQAFGLGMLVMFLIQSYGRKRKLV